MFEERIQFDYNSKTEQIFTTISERLRQGFKISLLFTSPLSTNITSPEKSRQQSTCMLPQAINEKSAIMSSGPNPIAQQIQPKNVNVEEMNTERTEEVEPNQHSALQKKLNQAIENFNKENYTTSLAQFQSLYLQTEYVIQNSKLKQSKKKSVYIIQIQVIYYISQVYKHENKPLLAIERLEYLLKNFIINDQDTITKLTQELAQLFMMAHKFNKALDIYERLLKEYERLNWKADIAYTLCNIGLIYALYQHNEEAKKIGVESISIAKSVLSVDDLKLKECYYLMGYIYFLAKETDFALEFLEQSVPDETLHGDSYLLIKSLNLLAVVQNQKGLFKQSIQSYQKALEHSKEKHHGHLLNNMGLIFMEQGHISQAKKVFEKAHLLISKGQLQTKTRAKKNIDFMLTNLNFQQ
ncbi:hypothetical protein pb186bvf_005275 [Paramecium bursaria]